MAQAVTMQGLPTPKVGGCGAWHPGLRKPRSKGRQDGRERECWTGRVCRQDTHTRPSTRVHTPTSTNKHTPMHGLVHACTRPHPRTSTRPCTGSYTHAHTQKPMHIHPHQLPLTKPCRTISEKEAPVSGKDGCSATAPLELPTRAVGTETPREPW